MEVLAQIVPIRLAALDDEPVLGESRQRLLLVSGPAGGSVLDPIEQRRDVGGDDQLCVRERVHQEDLVQVLQRHTNVEHGRLHAGSLREWVWKMERSDLGPVEESSRIHRRRVSHRATDIPTGRSAVHKVTSGMGVSGSASNVSEIEVTL
jgi:hypothetical protein